MELKVGIIRGYTQNDVPKCSKLTSTTIKAFVSNRIQDERALSCCYRRRDMFVCLLISHATEHTEK